MNRAKQILDTSNLIWRRGKKTKGMRAKALINLIVDPQVFDKFLIDTLEGHEPANQDSIFCIGETGDAWQQSTKALFKKYDIKMIDSDGWMFCEPKAENEVEFIELDKAFLHLLMQPQDVIKLHRDDDTLINEELEPERFIVGLWGATVDGVENLQSFVRGDFLCRQPHEHADQWIVRRKLFKNTYTELLGET